MLMKFLNNVFYKIKNLIHLLTSQKTTAFLHYCEQNENKNCNTVLLMPLIDLNS